MKKIVTIFEQAAESNWFLALQQFLDRYGLYIAAALIGIVIGLLCWLKAHPEDFYYVTEESEEEAEANGDQKQA